MTTKTAQQNILPSKLSQWNWKALWYEEVTKLNHDVSLQTSNFRNKEQRNRGCQRDRGAASSSKWIFPFHPKIKTSSRSWFLKMPQHTWFMVLTSMCPFWVEVSQVVTCCDFLQSTHLLTHNSFTSIPVIIKWKIAKKLTFWWLDVCDNHR